jgi:nitroreductase
MDVLEAIKKRRSIGKVKPDPVDKQLINQVLEAATWAPNHHLTEPWKFFVLTGEGRRLLGRTLAEIAEETIADTNEQERQEKLMKIEEKAFRAPVIITVAAVPSSNPKVEYIEEIGAVIAAIQNMLLAAHALGLGAIWRTGKACYHPKMKKCFGLSDRDEVLGFIYIGYPDLPPRMGKRTSFEDKTIWIDSDQKV